MSNVVINDSHLIDIGNAIREKAKTEDRYKPRDMAEAILSIQGGATIIPPEAGTLTGIVISKLPNKIDYNAGESINLEGLEVTSQYDNGVTGIVTDACTIEVETPLVKEETKVLVTYESFTTSFTVNVYGQPLEVPPGTVYLSHCDGNVNNEVSVVVSTPSLGNVAYSSDGKFHSGSIKGTSAYANFTVESDSIPTKTELNSSASITVEGWFKNTSTSFTSFQKFLRVVGMIYVAYKNNNEYEVSNGLKNTITVIGDSYNDWVHIAVVVKNGILKFFVNGKKLGESELSVNTYPYRNCKFLDSSSTAYVDEVLISTEALYDEDFIPPTGPYGGKRILQKLIVESQPTKTDYLVGETFSLNGAVIKAVYSDASQIDVTSDCFIVGDGLITETTDFVEISYTYESVTKTVFINIGRLSE